MSGLGHEVWRIEAKCMWKVRRDGSHPCELTTVGRAGTLTLLVVVQPSTRSNEALARGVSWDKGLKITSRANELLIIASRALSKVVLDMGTESREIVCPWCGKLIPVPKVELGRYKNDYGTVIERRCPKCDKVLAAYLEEEGGFLPRIRRF